MLKHITILAIVIPFIVYNRCSVTFCSRLVRFTVPGGCVSSRNPPHAESDAAAPRGSAPDYHGCRRAAVRLWHQLLRVIGDCFYAISAATLVCIMIFFSFNAGTGCIFICIAISAGLFIREQCASIIRTCHTVNCALSRLFTTQVPNPEIAL